MVWAITPPPTTAAFSYQMKQENKLRQWEAAKAKRKGRAKMDNQRTKGPLRKREAGGFPWGISAQTWRLLDNSVAV